MAKKTTEYLVTLCMRVVLRSVKEVHGRAAEATRSRILIDWCFSLATLTCCKQQRRRHVPVSPGHSLKHVRPLQLVSVRACGVKRKHNGLRRNRCPRLHSCRPTRMEPLGLVLLAPTQSLGVVDRGMTGERQVTKEQWGQELAAALIGTPWVAARWSFRSSIAWSWSSRLRAILPIHPHRP